jgi:hypothetical protein
MESTKINSVGHKVLPVAETEPQVNVKVTLEQAMKAQRGSRGIALLFP